MSKVIKVSKISLHQLDLLRAAGYVVEIEQATITPKNPRHKYDLADTISVLTRSHRQGTDKDKVKPKADPRKNLATSNNLESLKRRMGVYNEKD